MESQHPRLATPCTPLSSASLQSRASERRQTEDDSLRSRRPEPVHVLAVGLALAREGGDRDVAHLCRALGGEGKKQGGGGSSV